MGKPNGTDAGDLNPDKAKLGHGEETADQPSVAQLGTDPSRSALSRVFNWEAVKTLLTVAGLVVSGLALWISNSTANKSRELQEQAQELQEQSVEIQKTSLANEQGVMSVSRVWVGLSKGGGDEIIYPQQNSRLESIPLEVWSDNPVRYGYFTVANTGTTSIFLIHGGFGTTEKGFQLFDLSTLWCQKRNEPKYVHGCPTSEVLPQSELSFAAELTPELISVMDEDWQSKGLEVCVRREADSDGFLDCTTSRLVALPRGVQGAVTAPAPTPLPPPRPPS
ncbi:hypothetical protein [Rhodococcus sp. IEGM 1307]|uniref:hypothetical protein n=1 Tax=Rhodococcus sp. IEGM 1307 TaxID=3047091 RepID=UPI0024B6B317|nr:hypothetical protein [Rhodococcus sp. IEGM 1307]MDI9980066.1 hypothetical protein [Rhodococcus sp. IEGM 1307]